ncbi:MAG: S8 family serine peptidase [Candidatus Electryonea clarkiae]|nr:S8 family serine peptidase [Candidatus Electryonea clarkiae]MDP8287989.1 S8 family serine peptidase [Candidatus Electryonea clarkiae]
MKKTLSLYTAALIFAVAFQPVTYASKPLTPQLQEAMKIAEPGEQLPVVIFMSERPDITELREIVEGLPRKDRARLVWDEVISLSERTQHDLVEYLGKEVEKGNAERIRRLRTVNGIAVRASKEIIKTIALRNEISRIIYDPPREAFFDNEDRPGGSELDELAWGVEQINAEWAWEEGYTGEGILVGVIDTGVNYNHPDLEEQLWDGGDDYPNYGYDFGLDDDDPMDEYGHGTHVAGTVCGDGENGTQTGVAPDAVLVCMKVGYGTSEADQATVWDAHDFSIEQELDVTTMSMGWIPAWNPDRSAWRETYDVLETAGIVNLVAAGNERGTPPPTSCRTPGNVPSPWRHPDEVEEGGRGGVISVGATDDQDNFATFSSRGPVEWEDVDNYNDWPLGGEHVGLIRPDIAAPGVNVLSTSIALGYTQMSGTSMATPHMAGVVCLMLSKNPDLLPAQIDSILQFTALELGDDGKDNDYGSGRVKADSAVANAYVPTGYLFGVVSDANTGDLLDSVVVNIVDARGMDTTSLDGEYFMPLVEGYHTIMVNQHPYNLFEMDSVLIVEFDTLELNIELAVGIFDLSEDSIGIDVIEDSLRSFTESFTVYNNGSGFMDVEFKLEPVLELDSFLDPVFDFNISDSTGDLRMHGAAFHDRKFYISGSNNTDNPNKIYVFDEEGEYLESFDQPEVELEDIGADPLGMRDLASDGAWIWGGIGDSLIALDPEDGSEMVRFVAPYNPCNAIAYDSDRDILWVSAAMQDIKGINPGTGAVVDSILSPRWIMGMGYWRNDPSGPSLILSVRDPEDNDGFYRASPETHEIQFLGDPGIIEGNLLNFSFAEGYDTHYLTGIGILNQLEGDHLAGWEFATFVGWAELDPMELSIIPYDSQLVTVSFDGRNLFNGTYQGLLTAYHNTLTAEDTLTLTISVDVEEEPEDFISDRNLLPQRYEIEAVYPNPFNQTALIRVALPQTAKLTLNVYNILGEQVTSLTKGTLPAGYHEISFNASGMSSGMYFVHASVPGKMNELRKIVLIK